MTLTTKPKQNERQNLLNIHSVPRGRCHWRRLCPPALAHCVSVNSQPQPQQNKIMQAIETKYLPATNTKPSRIKATCERGSITLPWDDSLDVDGNHHIAALYLRDDFVAQDAAKYGSVSKSNPWAGPIVSGCLPSGNYAHVFVS